MFRAIPCARRDYLVPLIRAIRCSGGATWKTPTISRDELQFVNGIVYIIVYSEPPRSMLEHSKNCSCPLHLYRGKSGGDWPAWVAKAVMCRHGDAAAAEKSDSHKNFEAALDAVANASAAGLPEAPGVRMAPANAGSCLRSRSRGASRVTRVACPL